MLKTTMNRRGLSTLHIVLIIAAVVLLLAITCAGIGMAMALPALAQARQMAQGFMSATQLSQIEMARDVFAARYVDDEQRPSFTVQQLIDDNFITLDLANSPLGPVSDGRGDFWVNPILVPDDEHGSPGEQRIGSYDRAMYESDQRVAVCFYGNQCEVVEFDEFQRLLELPINAGTDFDLPARLR